MIDYPLNYEWILLPFSSSTTSNSRNSLGGNNFVKVFSPQIKKLLKLFQNGENNLIS